MAQLQVDPMQVQHPGESKGGGADGPVLSLAIVQLLKSEPPIVAKMLLSGAYACA